MSINDVLRNHGCATLMMNVINNNGTAWFCSDGNSCNSGVDYRVLVQDRQAHEFKDGVQLGILARESDVLEVSVDGVTIY